MQPKNPRSGSEQRRHARVLVKVFADLQWQGADGHTRHTRAACLDISEGGLCLQATSETPGRGDRLMVRLDDWVTAERGIVRHARLRGIVGIELQLHAASPAELQRWRNYIASAHAAQGS